ncbi:hypothetical protein QBC45DRAFT_175890 [Copromyces sp. CBS 386.78]|nr:hypothetical protein QBC45DRAFT_175890 [Copromyces sp. CBS 386.78]
MAEIYGNCVVGIAALGCGTGEDADRCFTERNPFEVIPYKIGPKPDETHTPCTPCRLARLDQSFCRYPTPCSREAGCFRSACSR